MSITCGKCGYSGDVRPEPKGGQLVFTVIGNAPQYCLNGKAVEGEAWNCPDFDKAYAEAEKAAKS
jgi:hypothetical protein